MLHLSPRLFSVAKMLSPGLKTVDVGTDHGYLPAFLVLSGKLEHVLACDIGELPLENAKATVNLYGLQNQIELRLSDGLKNVRPEEAGQISISGMGGTLIAEILEAAPWIKTENMRLCLQPQSHFEDVRRYLCQNGFCIEREECVTDCNRLYCCISAVFNGQTDAFSPGFYYFGLIKGENADEKKYIQKQITHVTTRLTALQKADRFPEEQRYLTAVTEYYKRNYQHESN